MVNTSDILPNTPRYLKVPLIFFNLVLWILGVILIALGGWTLNQLKNVNGLDINVTLPSGLVVLGVFIIVLTIIGCIVAYKEHLVGLIAYTIIILILLICLIGVGGAAFSYRGQTGDLLTKAWGKADPGVREPLQRFFDCCGWAGVNTSFANATLHDGSKCLLPRNYTVPNNNNNNNATTGNNTAARSSLVFLLRAPQNDTDPTEAPTEAPTTAPTTAPTAEPTAEPTAPPNNTHIVVEWIPNTNTSDCQPILTGYVKDRLYVAGVAGVVIGVIEFVCMLFSLFLIVRLCKSPRSRSYD